MAFLGLILTLVLGLLVLMAGAQWLQGAGSRRTELPPGVTPERLDRLESALAALDARLDELQEQQRFLERLLEDRPEPPSLPPPGPGQPDSILFDVRRGADEPGEAREAGESAEPEAPGEEA